MAHNRVAYKYILKVFYKWTNKKKYKSQILKHNIRYTNVIAMQNAIIKAKLLIGSAIKELVIDIPDTKVTQVCSTTNMLLKYNQHQNPTNNEAVVDLGLQSVKKYW